MRFVTAIAVAGYEENKRSKELLADVQSMKVSAYFKDGLGERANSDLQLLSHFSPNNHHIKVSTSTQHAKVRPLIATCRCSLLNERKEKILLILSTVKCGCFFCGLAIRNDPKQNQL